MSKQSEQILEEQLIAKLQSLGLAKTIQLTENLESSLTSESVFKFNWKKR
jgi:hypothetical protein